MAEIIAQAFLDEPSPRAVENLGGKTVAEVVGLLKGKDYEAAIQFAEFARYYRITGRAMAL